MSLTFDPSIDTRIYAMASLIWLTESAVRDGHVVCMEAGAKICPDLITIALSTRISSLLHLPPIGYLALQFLPFQIFEDGPIIHMIIIEALAHEEITKDFT